MQQNAAGTLGATAITRINTVATHVDTVGVGHAHAQPTLCEQVGDQAHRGGFSIGAGDGNYRNTAVLPLLEHAGDDGFAYGPPFAKRRAKVHAQARCGVHFDNAAALFFNGTQDAVAHHVHATNVQPHHVRRSHGTGGYIGVYVIGYIGSRAAGRQIGVVAQVDALALGRNVIGLEALRGQTTVRNVVETDFGQ